MTQWRSAKVTPVENKIENVGRAVIIRAAGARVVEMEGRGSIIRAAGVNAFRRSESTVLV